MSRLFTHPHTYFFKWAILGLYSIYFRLFIETIQILQQINVKKCPSSIQCWDSNSQPSDFESPPLTTKPGLPPLSINLCLVQSISPYLHQFICPVCSRLILANSRESSYVKIQQVKVKAIPI